MKTRKKYCYILLIFIIANIIYSFWQYKGHWLDGDMARIILPAGGYKAVLDDPLGIKVLTENAKYSGTNRYFCHLAMSKYFKKIPPFLQKITNPIESVYLACGFAKVFIEILIVYILAVIISGKKSILNRDFLVAAILVIPLLQSNGFERSMGIVDRSISYAFFYGLPIGFLLLYFSPFLISIIHKKELKISYGLAFLLIISSFMLSFSGPLVSPLVLILFPLIILIYMLKSIHAKNRISLVQKVYFGFSQMPNRLLLCFILFCIFSVYSIYIGLNNIENFIDVISLSDRYSRIPLGLYKIVTKQMGLPLLLSVISINILFMKLKHCYNDESKKVLKIFLWIFIFCISYIMLLPFGGYRHYREYIIRYDVMIPVTLSMIIIYGLSSLYLLKNIKTKKYAIAYVLFVLGVSIYFAVSDKPGFKNNQCEKNAILSIAKSPKFIVALNQKCKVMSWKKIKNYRESVNNSNMLYEWNITKYKKLYYNKY